MHAALLLLLVAATLHGVACTTLELHVKYPKQNFLRPDKADLYLRGDALGLNWDRGIFIPFLGNDEWQVNLTYSSASANKRFEFKVGIETR